MKISEKTINVLKNFSAINPSILIRPGNTISTLSPQKSIVAKATIDEEFPQQFAIYELSKFLGILSLFENPEFEFGESQVTIKQDKQAVSYTYADPIMIVSPPEKEIKFPTSDYSFKLSAADLSKTLRAVNVMQLPEVAIHGDGKQVFLKGTNSKNSTSDAFSILVGDSDKKFKMVLRIDNMKMINQDYDVDISFGRIIRFSAPNVVYHIAIEANLSSND
jgi:hypothetical protein